MVVVEVVPPCQRIAWAVLTYVHRCRASLEEALARKGFNVRVNEPCECPPPAAALGKGLC